jgi:signal transduction histidine kinase
LWGLIEAGIFLSEELDLHTVLRRVVETACRVIGARYGALGVLNDERSGLSDFVFHGLSEADREEIGHLPVGRGLLGALIADPSPIRLPDLSADPRSVGFPENHPPMKSFLGVPVRAKGQIFGNLYLTEKEGSTEFTDEDERLAIAFAAQAGVAVENARLYEEARQRAEIEAELAETRVRSELRDQTLKAVIRAQEEERRRVARELHDSAGQALMSILLGLKIVGQERTLQEARGRLADLRDVVAIAADEVQRIVRELRPSVLDDVGLPAALERYAEDLGQRTGLVLNLAIELNDQRLDPEIETVVYRVAQEALTNVVKYANATSVDLALHERGDVYVLSVTDDGEGFDLASQEETGLGIRGMRERADLVGGRLDVRSVAGQGASVTLEVPRKPVT